MVDQGGGEPPEGLDLTPVEVGLWEAYRSGVIVDLGAGDPRSADERSGWGPEREVRAQVIALLLLNGPTAHPGRAAALKLRGAQITGALDLSNSEISVPVELQRCRLEWPLRLADCKAGSLLLEECYVPRVDATRLVTESQLGLKNCHLPWGLQLSQAQIGLDLTLDDLKLGHQVRGKALYARGLNVAQDLKADRLRATGELDMRGARVGGAMILRRGELRSPSVPRVSVAEYQVLGPRPRGKALYAEGLVVAEGLKADRLRATGEVDMRGARFGGPMSLRGCELRNPSGTAFNASRLVAEAGLALSPAAHPLGSPALHMAPSDPVRSHACIEGSIHLDSAVLGGPLDLDYVQLELGEGQELSLRDVQAPEMVFTPRRPEQGKVVLRNAVIGQLHDRADSWPAPGGLDLRGFTYESLHPRGHFPISRRLQWVAAATPEFVSEPYDRLAASLRAAGDEAEANVVLLAKLRRRRETLPLALKAWEYIQDAALGYGYLPGRAAVWLATLWALGSVWFAKKPPPALNPDEAPHWEPVIYTLDLLLPILNLGQETAWRTSGASQWIALVLVVLGWILATIVTAGAAALIFRRN